MVWRSITKKTLLPSTFLMTFLIIPLVSAHAITVPTNVYFGFGSGSYINFNTQMTFDTVYREAGIWHFNGYQLSVEHANMTVNTFFYNDVTFEATLNGAHGTVATIVVAHKQGWMPATVTIGGQTLMPKPTKADYDTYNGNTWYHETQTGRTYIKAQLTSPTFLAISYAAPAPTPTPTPTPSPYETPTPAGPIPTWLLLTAIAVITIIAYALLRWR